MIVSRKFKPNCSSDEEDDETAEERDTRLLESLKCSSHGHVTLNEENQLMWPVRLLYPEHATSDVIQQFSEVRESELFRVAGVLPESRAIQLILVLLGVS